MAKKGRYQTRRREELLEYLSKRRGEHHTAAQIRDHLATTGSRVGIATVYRQLDALVQEGLVRRYALSVGESACYEYVGEESGRACSTHFHCKCDQCGALIHLDCHELQAIQEHLLKGHGFQWNAGRTVFYGICDQCLHPTA